MKLHIIMHESFEAPAAFKDWAIQKNHPITYTRLYQGDEYLSSVDGFDFLIVMGGPQSPATTTEECSYFDVIREISFIKKALDADKYVVGVCLGAQLIGEALGAKFGHSPNKEIGVFNITLTKEAKDDPIFSSFPTEFLVGHWHGDMPGLTKESVILAKSEGCPRQIIRYSPKVYGLQCHFEFTSAAINGMVQNCAHELEQAATSEYVETAEELKAHDYRPINGKLFQFLDAMQSNFEAEQKSV